MPCTTPRPGTSRSSCVQTRPLGPRRPWTPGRGIRRLDSLKPSPWPAGRALGPRGCPCPPKQTHPQVLTKKACPRPPCLGGAARTWYGRPAWLSTPCNNAPGSLHTHTHTRWGQLRYSLIGHEMFGEFLRHRGKLKESRSVRDHAFRVCQILPSSESPQSPVLLDLPRSSTPFHLMRALTVPARLTSS